MKFSIYTDCSIDVNTGIAGIGIVIVYKNKVRKIVKYRLPYCMSTMIGEAFAILYAAQMMPNEDVTIYSDSKVNVEFCNGQTLPSGSNTKALLGLFNKYVNVEVKYVKGHSKNEFNKLADREARNARYANLYGRVL